MTVDPFTAASCTYSDAVRSLRSHKEGSALQIMPKRPRWLWMIWLLGAIGVAFIAGFSKP